MTSPPPPNPAVPVQIQQHDAAALALEVSAAAAVVGLAQAQIDAALASTMRVWLGLFGDMHTRQFGPRVRSVAADLAAAVRRINLDQSSVMLDHAAKARTLGVKQAWVELGSSRQPVSTAVDFTTHVAVTRAVQAAQAKQRASSQLLAFADHVSYRDLEARTAPAVAATRILDATTSTVTNTELNAGITAVADRVGAQRVWVAERDACLHCLALSGLVVDVGFPFPMDVTFAKKPLEWVPISAGGLTGPPRHPRCRCRCSPWLGHNGPEGSTDLPTALRREAERSVLRGASESESKPAKIQAADQLLMLVGAGKNSRSPSGWQVPASVKQRAELAVKRGQFTTKTP